MFENKKDIGFKITTKSAKIEHSEKSSHLSYLAMGQPFADFFIGIRGTTNARYVLSQLFIKKGNRFSHQYADVALINPSLDETVVGLLISYPGKMLRALSIKTAVHLFYIYGVRMFYFLKNVLPLVGINEAKSDEYYINTLAVLPEFNGKGIGKRLLLYAEEKAKRFNLKKCSLCVEMENKRAFKLYEKNGYKIVDSVELKYGGVEGFYRMLKDLEG